ncbi:hypothetical protein AB4156_13200 [Cupriavidus sp. 2MCAB6]|uniref:hypothetical protein n=1 Tax=Cupriavidus sp. 2MCAB6 TaxID=3232981 RepID=UPI003F91A301
MKRVASVVLLSAIGAVIGLLASLPLARFVPICGEDCSGQRLAQTASWSLGTAALFLLAGIFWFRSPASHWTNWLVRLVVLVLLVGGASAASYVHKLQVENEYLHSIREIQRSSDFPTLVILKKEVSVLASSEADGSPTLFRAARWERCAIGRQESLPPRRIEIQCRAGTGWLSAEDAKNLIAVAPRDNHP